MDLSFRRGEAKSSVVVAGSVWETRMKNDEVKGGIKVFNGEGNGNITEQNGNAGGTGDKRLSLKKGPTVGGGMGKRKAWKNESFEGLEKNPIQISKGKTQIQVAKGRSMEHCKDLSLSVDGINKKSPVQVKKGMREVSKSVDGIERSPIHMKKPRSELPKKSAELSKNGNEAGERMEGNSVQLRKAKSDQTASNGKRNERDEKVLALDDQKAVNDASIEENEKNGSGSEDLVGQENAITSSTSNGDLVGSSPGVSGDDGDGVEDDEEFSEEEGEEEEEIEVDGNEKKSFDDIKEVNIQEKKPEKVADEVKKLPETKPEKAVNEVKKSQEDKPSKIVNEVKKTSQFHNRTAPFSSTVNKQSPPVVKRATQLYTTPTKVAKSSPFSASEGYHYQSFPQTQNKWQNLVDLAMWRDVSKSTLVFGMGTFIIISSSYTQDLNISCVSAISYMCLVYLAVIFLYRSIICRGVVDTDESSYVVGEEEAFWLLKLVLPYLNEFLIKLRALFSGDPATTMKLAVLLFVLARCGSSITIWKMTKLGFFGVFTVPKVCSSYSQQLTAYGKFWIRRFRDAWESCTHKKAVAMAIFTLVWNLCSVVARIWAAFMLFVALRYYQQKMVADGWVVEDEAGPSCGQTSKGPTGTQRHGLAPSRVDVIKES